MNHEDPTSQQMERLTIAAQNTITHWSDLEVRGHLKEHPGYVLHDLDLIEDMIRTVRKAAEAETAQWGALAGDPHQEFEDQVTDYRNHTCTCDYCYQQEPDPDLDPDYLYEPFSTPTPAHTKTPCAKCGKPQWNADGDASCHDCRRTTR
ncbi:hypothetical protein [Nocardiopsis sp. CA-288880]|uniref:hypothetical protein n=1 Tax=Nocardiopsis sp. CA-288880 TaxID=3239995 RepID=UPI003D979A28